MKKFLLLNIFSCIFMICRAEVPDTSGIPVRWKKESLIILSEKYRLTENSSGIFNESFHCIYYVRDKFGLRQISTLTIPGDIKAGDNTEIGRIYRKDGSVISITGKHLTPRQIKIGKSSSATGKFSYESGQKLAIPGLAVGDILEIEYSAERHSLPSTVSMASIYPTMRKEFYASVTASQFFTGYASTYFEAFLYFRPVNFTSENISNTDQSITVTQDTVERIKDEILTDDKKLYPYLILFKSHFDPAKAEFVRNYIAFSGEELETKQLSIVRSIYYRGDKIQKTTASVIWSKLHQKHPIISDTIAWMNDAFYFYREMYAPGSVFDNVKANYPGDKFFVNVMSRLLFKAKIPYKVFLTQPDYYGKPVSESTVIDPHYGIVLPRLKYYLFNPVVYNIPGDVPSYFETQGYVEFAANKHFKPYRFPGLLGVLFLPIALPVYIVTDSKANKYRKFGFEYAEFPSSDPEQNLVNNEITLKDFDFTKNTCIFSIRTSYLGKAKASYSRRLCSSTLCYETCENPYRRVSRKEDEKLASEYLKKFISGNISSEGHNVCSVKTYSLEKGSFFSPGEPIVVSADVEVKDFFVSAGKYVVLNVGQLLGEQLQPNRDTVRQNNFFIPYRKKYAFRLNIKLPPGYVADDVSSLNGKFQSAAGKFVSQASANGDGIVVNTEKIYTFQHYDKGKASEVNGFLALADDFTHLKILLRKK
jgi:hypothetical protein